MFDNQTINGGWEASHQRLKKAQLDDDDRWRLRDWDNHPADPGWEDGTYSTCHPTFRTKVQSGDIVFDTVSPGDPTKTDPIIRSAFVVEDTSDGVLSFEEFIFFDGEADAGVCAQMSRGHKRLDASQVEEYLQQLEEQDEYTCYSVGSEPKSIRTELWERMLEKAGTCSTCSSCNSQDEDSNGDCD